MSTTLNGDCCVSLMQGTLVRPVARYPGSIAGDDPLKLAANRVRTTLIRNVSSGDTLFTVGDASRIVPQMLLSVGHEIVSVSAASDNILTVIRGFDGTQPCAHSAGSLLEANITAWHHNVLAAEITAIETALGPGLSNVVNGGSGTILSSAYDFAAQTPGVNLIAGNNTITLSPVPLGVNGTDTDHYLYVSGGTGAAEAVLITGGSAASGAASGQLIIQCANAHTGAWTIRTATSGIQEAIQAAGGSRVSVQLPPSTLTNYAPVTVHGEYVCVYGQGQSTLISAAFGWGPVFHFSASGNFPPQSGFMNSIRNFRISGQLAGSPSAGLQIRGQLVFRATDLYITRFWRGIWLNDTGNAVSSAIWIERCFLEIFTPADGVAFEQFGGADIYFTGNHLTSDPDNPAAAGIYLAETKGTKLISNEVYGFSRALYIRPGSGHYVSAVNSIGNWYDSSRIDGVRINPDGTGIVSEFMSTQDRIGASQDNGITIVGTSANIQAIIFTSTASCFNLGQGIYLSGGQDVEFNGCHVYGNSYTSAGTNHGLFVDTGTTRFAVHGGTYAQSSAMPGGTPPNTQGYGIAIAGGCDNFIIDGPVVKPNVAGGLNDLSTGQNKIIRNILPYPSELPTAPGTGPTLTLGTEPYEAVLVTGSGTVTAISPSWPGRRVLLMKNDGGTVTFSPSANIHKGATLTGADGAVTAQFYGTKWVLL